jgi:hypothetical protein
MNPKTDFFKDIYQFLTPHMFEKIHIENEKEVIEEALNESTHLEEEKTQTHRYKL